MRIIFIRIAVPKLTYKMKFLKSLFASANVFTLSSESVQTFSESWPQIKVYYETLSKTTQAAEKGNLEPIKSNSENLLEKAEALSIEGMPAEYRNPKTIDNLLSLKKQTTVVDQLVKKDADDNQIKSALTKLHDIFYSIVEFCLNGK